MSYWGTRILQGDTPGEVLFDCANQFQQRALRVNQQEDIFITSLALFTQVHTFEDFTKELREHDNFKKFRQSLLSIPEGNLLVDFVENDYDDQMNKLSRRYGPLSEKYKSYMDYQKIYFNPSWIRGERGLKLFVESIAQFIDPVIEGLGDTIVSAKFEPEYNFIGYLGYVLLLPRCRSVQNLISIWQKNCEYLEYRDIEFTNAYFANLKSVLKLALDDEVILENY